MKKGKLLFNLALAAAILVPILQAEAKPPTASNIRPIEDFVDRQGTFCIDVNFTGSYEDEVVDGNFVGNCSTGAPPLLFVPPIANFLGTADPDQNRGASIDYAGLADYWSGGAFGTSFAGSVVERPLADGRAHVSVILRTENALTFVVQGSDYNVNLLFGNRAPDVAYGAEPALGSASMELVFINTAPGADLPDLLQLAVFPAGGQELLTLKIGNKAKGPLTELFGVPDGTPGLNTGTQVGLLGNPQCGLEPSALLDCFPVERINLRVIGQ
jgi:hypothetical protein